MKTKSKGKVLSVVQNAVKVFTSRESSDSLKAINALTVENNGRKDTLIMATISIKEGERGPVVMALVNERPIRISNLKHFMNEDRLSHGQKIMGYVFRYDEINGERAFKTNGKYVRFKIVRAYC